MLLLTALACKAPVEAPSDLDDLTKYMYANFNGDLEDGPDAMVAGMGQLEDYLLTLDMAADTDDRAVSLTPLTEDFFNGAVGPSNLDTTVQVSVAVSGQTGMNMATEVGLIMEPNQVCIASDTTAYHAVTVLSGGDCFEAGDCELMETSNEFLIDSISDGWIDSFKDYRWVEMEDGRMAVVAREWMPEVAPALSGDNSWDQRFALVAWIPTQDGNSTMRFYALWSSVTTVLSDDAYATLVKNALDEYYVNAETFADGGDCDNDRDREYDRE